MYIDISSRSIRHLLKYLGKYLGRQHMEPVCVALDWKVSCPRRG